MSNLYKLTKIGVAVDQLDWSIKMLIDYSAYVPAIALAGAAEEVLGRLVGEQAAFYQLRIKISADHNISEKAVANEHLNKLGPVSA